ncbi:MAG: DNA ligase-associated DEXH box helicase [Nitrosopumilus sp.]|nr:DNA ligase-associated DEXH box helicase [Nitrosopumilus sp.]
MSPDAKRIGLSGTVKEPALTGAWLGGDHTTHIIQEKKYIEPKVKILYSKKPLPLMGYFPTQHLISELYQLIQKYQTNIIFINTRAQAEKLFHMIWAINKDNLPIALHHGSLSKEQRLKIEEAMTKGQLKAVIATSSLELGIDWGNVDMVINMGAPKGISRLLQRIGRSNHTFDIPSQAYLVPQNCFEALECEAALSALKEYTLDDSPPRLQGSLDTLAQHIMSCACAEPIDPQKLHQEVTRAYPYRYLNENDFLSIFDFVKNGGYVLKHYENFHKLVCNENQFYQPTSSFIQKIHRLNIGTIVSDERMKLMLVTGIKSGKRKRGKGTYLGDIDEKFILNLKPDDTFLFAGQNLSFLGINGLNVEVSLSKNKEIRIPNFVGYSLSLTTNLSMMLKKIIETAHDNKNLPNYIQQWLKRQQKISILPQSHEILAEIFQFDKLYYMTIYTFEGRAINQALGFLLSYRFEKAGLNPLGFSISDYGLSIRCINPFSHNCLENLWDPDLCLQAYEDWIRASNMLKRHFKHTATVSGLIYHKYPGLNKSGRQVLFSTDLIYDVLNKHEPDHIILKGNRMEVERDLIAFDRLKDILISCKQKIRYQFCQSITPFSIPIIVQSMRENLNNSAQDLLLELTFYQYKAEELYKSIEHD